LIRRSFVVACALAACAPSTGSSTSAASAAEPRTWERPGLGGAVRPEMGSPQPGEIVPDFDLPDLGGTRQSLRSLRGRWVLLHFTATWCPFCDSEVSHLGELADAFGPRGVRTVIVDVEEAPAAWKSYAAEHVAPSVLALLDETGAQSTRFAPPRAQPSFVDRAQAILDSTWIIDPEGRIRLFLMPDSAHFDPTFKAVRAELDRLVPEPVVTVRTETRGIEGAPGNTIEVPVQVRVGAGYHVMSDHPSAPTYIPTRVALEPADGVSVGTTSYPPASTYAIGPKTIATFDGTFDVKVPVTVAPGAPAGPRTLRGTLRYQACTESRCLFPTTLPFEVTLSVR
jgi:peroxiredoxin